MRVQNRRNGNRRGDQQHNADPYPDKPLHHAVFKHVRGGAIPVPGLPFTSPSQGCQSCLSTLPRMRLRLAGMVFVLSAPLMAQIPASDLLMQQAAGTSRNPQSASMAMISTMTGNWMLHGHGQLFINRVDESGPRGHSKTFSTNWFMGSAMRSVGRGAIQFRTMLSLEPATITQRRYPELFQTGETAFGRQLIDGQHPHEFFMELSASFAHPIGPALGYIYVAPVGDPALGPVAFPHRTS